ncbi:SDR family oxidoreductase [Paenibacillus thalictri]|uniref:SDR family oxidoreductase n=1 Tax=Paenibacillus thalictri TaxID=2527873 RepID=A0A4Q9DY19_9BACL|nr:SDR family oxidoreductase [Paenibacillus thalictri]TBL80150.1 SDR family oxidoreductase [Paenibacillus thalictri]
MSSIQLHGKVALVSGGARGIGAAAAKLLAQQGAKVVVNFAEREDAALDVVDQIAQQGGDAVAVRADVRDEKQVQQMVAETESRFGAIDILVSNANMQFVMKPILQMNWEEFSQKLNDEMKAAFVLTQAVTPVMIKRNYGRIIYVSSSSADLPTPYLGAHGAAKAALNGFVKYIAQELGPHGVTANAVSPGLVQTDASRYTPEQVKEQIAMATPLGRVAVPDDISGVIAFLASEESRFLTGTCTHVNGGILML